MTILKRYIFSFLKKILKVRTTTPNFFVYGELGRYPLDISIKVRTLCFWSKLISTEKLSSKIYRLLFHLYNEGNHEFIFVKHVKSIFDSTGLCFIFRNQLPINVNWIKCNVKQILVDQFIQNWRSQIANSSRGHFYSIFKQEFCLEPYLLRVEQQNRHFLTKFRESNMKIPIETGRWYNINKENRKCTKCSDNLIGGEFHYLFVCTNPDVVNLRTRYIPKYYLRNSSIEKMAELLSNLPYRIIEKLISVPLRFK